MKQRKAATTIQQAWRKHQAQRRILLSVVLLGKDVLKFEETILAKPDAKTETKVVFPTDDRETDSEVPEESMDDEKTHEKETDIEPIPRGPSAMVMKI